MKKKYNKHALFRCSDESKKCVKKQNKMKTRQCKHGDTQRSAFRLSIFSHCQPLNMGALLTLTKETNVKKGVNFTTRLLTKTHVLHSKLSATKLSSEKYKYYVKSRCHHTTKPRLRKCNFSILAFHAILAGAES